MRRKTQDIPPPLRLMPPQKQAYIYAISAVFLWSTAATAFKLSLRVLDPIQLLFYAVLASSIVLGLIIVAQGKWSAIFLCTRRQYLQSLGMGLLNPCAYYLVLLRAYDLLPAQEAQPLNYTWAIALALLSIPLLKQKLTLWGCDWRDGELCRGVCDFYSGRCNGIPIFQSPRRGTGPFQQFFVGTVLDFQQTGYARPGCGNVFEFCLCIAFCV